MSIWLLVAARTLLGMMFLSAGLDGLSAIIRGKALFDPPLSPAGKAFLETLKEAKAIWTAKSLVDIGAALMLLFNVMAPLGLLLLLPSIVVIILFQVTINRVGIPVAIVLGVLTAVALSFYGQHYLSLAQAEGAGSSVIDLAR